MILPGSDNARDAVRPALLHVLGGGPWQLPTIRLAKRLGLRVLVTDMHVDRPGYRDADFHETVSIADSEATLAVARRYRVDGIICDTTDVGVQTAACVASALGLPGIGIDAAVRCTRKDLMRRHLQAAGMPAPSWSVVRSAGELRDLVRSWGPPIIVKPVDNQSGNGVTKVEADSGIDAAYARATAATRQPFVLAEAYIEGTECIVDGFVVAGHPAVLAIAEKIQYTENPTISSRISYPGTLTAAQLARIESECCRTVCALGLSQGVFHAEFRVTDDAVIPLDIAARGGGVMIYTHVVPFVSGVDVNAAQVLLALGMSFPIEPRPIRRSANIEFFRLPPGELEAISGIEAASAFPGVLAVHIAASPGSRYDGLVRKDDRPGWVIGGGDTADESFGAAVGGKQLLRAHMRGAICPVPVL